MTPDSRHEKDADRVHRTCRRPIGVDHQISSSEAALYDYDGSVYYHVHRLGARTKQSIRSGIA